LGDCPYAGKWWKWKLESQELSGDVQLVETLSVAKKQRLPFTSSEKVKESQEYAGASRKIGGRKVE